MIRITILYPSGPGRRFDRDYYLGNHIPLALELLGPAVRSVTVDVGVSPGHPWPEPAFSAVCTFTCESLAAYQGALLAHAARLQADLGNYSDIAPIIQISELALEHQATP